MQTIRNDVRNMQMFLHNIHPMRVVEQGEVILFDHFPTVLLGFGIVVGGVLAAWVVYRLILWFGLPLKSQPRFRVARDANGRRKQEYRDPSTGKTSWRDIEAGVHRVEPGEESSLDVRPIYYSNRASIVHFLALSIKLLIIFFGFYIGFFVAGLSFFNLAISLGVIGILITYSFSAPIANTTGAFVIYGTGLWVEGCKISFPGDNFVSTIMQIGTMFTTVKYVNASGKLVLRTIPNRYFMEDKVDRHVQEEDGMEDFDATEIDRRVNHAISSEADPTFMTHLKRRRIVVK